MDGEYATVEPIYACPPAVASSAARVSNSRGSEGKSGIEQRGEASSALYGGRFLSRRRQLLVAETAAINPRRRSRDRIAAGRAIDRGGIVG